MSKTKRTPRPYLGHAMTKADQSAVASLVGMTINCFGISKRKIKHESEIWQVTEAMFGLTPNEDEDFVTAVRRIKNAIKRIPEEQRRICRQNGSQALGIPFRSPSPIRLVVSNAKPVDRITTKLKEDFYKSWEWRTLRMKVIKDQGKRCNCCGATPQDLTVGGSSVRLVVDHIKPLSKYWELRLTQSNLQILCDECNMGKGAWDETDHRISERGS